MVLNWAYGKFVSEYILSVSCLLIVSFYFRPLNNNEKKQGSPSVVEIIPDKKIIVKDKNVNREFLFDKVFPPETKQVIFYIF